MEVKVKLYATLRRYQPQLRLGEALTLSLPEGTTVGQLIEKLGIPANTVKTTFIRGRIVEPDQVLNDGDEVGIFPPIAGG